MKTILFGEKALTIEDVLDLSDRRALAGLSEEEKFRSRIRRGAEVVERHWREEKIVYGVNTGVGDSVARPIPPDLVAEFPRQLFTFHGCGLGRNLDAVETRAVLAARLASLCRGCSGVRLELLELLAALLRKDVLPRIPSEGSVGASGDLTPLSYVAAVLSGEREVLAESGYRPASEALQQTGLVPVVLRPKEALAVMNGTSVMTGLACLAYAQARSVSRAATRITALSVLALKGNKAHFNPFLFDNKPFPGQSKVARQIAADIALNRGYSLPANGRLQDTYALRCAPHVVGVLEDALTWMREWIEIELNSANDNPLVDPDEGSIHHGGNFYGGHIAFAMDALKLAVAHIADLLDRQVALLVSEKTNRGLPSNLTGAAPERQPVNHGFKAVHIAISSFTSEALKLTMPAGAFSRSTESHNQDKVSLGTIAARDCLRVLELTAQAAAGAMLAALQAFDLREDEGRLECSAELRALHDQVRKFSPKVGEDHALEGELRQLTGQLLSGALDGKETG